MPTRQLEGQFLVNDQLVSGPVLIETDEKTKEITLKLNGYSEKLPQPLPGLTPHPALYILSADKKTLFRVILKPSELLPTLAPDQERDPKDRLTYQECNLRRDQLSYMTVRQPTAAPDANHCVDLLESLQPAKKAAAPDIPQKTTPEFTGTLHASYQTQIEAILNHSGYIEESPSNPLYLFILKVALTADYEKICGVKSTEAQTQAEEDAELEIKTESRELRLSYLTPNAITKIPLRNDSTEPLTPWPTIGEVYDYITFLIKAEILKQDPLTPAEKLIPADMSTYHRTLRLRQEVKIEDSLLTKEALCMDVLNTAINDVFKPSHSFAEFWRIINQKFPPGNSDTPDSWERKAILYTLKTLSEEIISDVPETTRREQLEFNPITNFFLATLVSSEREIIPLVATGLLLENPDEPQDPAYQIQRDVPLDKERTAAKIYHTIFHYLKFLEIPLQRHSNNSNNLYLDTLDGLNALKKCSPSHKLLLLKTVDSFVSYPYKEELLALINRTPSSGEFEDIEKKIKSYLIIEKFLNHPSTEDVSETSVQEKYLHELTLEDFAQFFEILEFHKKNTATIFLAKNFII